ncbi:hypothetical protein MHU86_12925 [Fragilaria crotonensis]|nr:hypothetical protein MHU86_21717 [Fragilaria crotonensis]KAI2501548.1 hypothetical protein MHU86_12925 [Fragilaria crotonensis]
MSILFLLLCQLTARSLPTILSLCQLMASLPTILSTGMRADAIFACLYLPAPPAAGVPRSDVRVAAVAIKVELTPANDGAGIISGDEPIDDEIRFHTLAPVINLSALNAVGGMYTDEDPHEGTKEHETLPSSK